MLISLRTIFSEDIPPFSSRYPKRLESILAQIQSEYYEDTLEKAVMLFYLLIKSHPFFNGNKRTAILGLYEFLKNNVSELYIGIEAIFSDKLYEMAIKTAESNQDNIEEIKNYLRNEIDSYIIEY